MIKKKDLSKRDFIKMICLECESEYSANYNDYFLENEDHVFDCECGSKHLILMDKEYNYFGITPAGELVNLDNNEEE